MTLRNCRNNDRGVVKANAKEVYENAFSMAVEHDKMTVARKEELMAQIEKVASDDVANFSGVGGDIKLVEDETTGDVVIDLVAHSFSVD